MLSVSLERCCMTSFDVSNLPGRQTRVCGRQSSFSMCGISLTAPPFPSLSLSLSFCVLLSFAVCLCKFYADCRQSHWNDLSTRQALPSESISQLSIQLSHCMTVRQKCLSPCLSVSLCQLAFLSMLWQLHKLRLSATASSQTTVCLGL